MLTILSGTILIWPEILSLADVGQVGSKEELNSVVNNYFRDQAELIENYKQEIVRDEKEAKEYLFTCQKSPDCKMSGVVLSVSLKDNKWQISNEELLH